MVNPVAVTFFTTTTGATFLARSGVATTLICCATPFGVPGFGEPNGEAKVTAIDPQSPFGPKSTGAVTPNRTVVSLSRSIASTSLLFFAPCAARRHASLVGEPH